MNKDWTARQRVLAISVAIDKLNAARDSLRSAGANKAADYVARALKSVHGARNHARNRAVAETFKAHGLEDTLASTSRDNPLLVEQAAEPVRYWAGYKPRSYSHWGIVSL